MTTIHMNQLFETMSKAISKQEAADTLFNDMRGYAMSEQFSDNIIDLVYYGMTILEKSFTGQLTGAEKREVLLHTIDDLVESTVIPPFKDEYNSVEPLVLATIDVIATTNKHGFVDRRTLEESVVVGCLAGIGACLSRDKEKLPKDRPTKLKTK